MSRPVATYEADEHEIGKTGLMQRTDLSRDRGQKEVMVSDKDRARRWMEMEMVWHELGDRVIERMSEGERSDGPVPG